MDEFREAHSAHVPRNLMVAVEAQVSDHAIDAGLELARIFGARIECVHAFAGPASGGAHAAASGHGTDHLALSCAVERIARARGVSAPALCAIAGKPAPVLLERALEMEADLIVLGAPRPRALVDFGSTARAILARAACPVLVQPVPVRAIRRILVPVDLSTESLLALAAAIAWARTLRAQVQALCCCNAASALAGTTWGGFGVAQVVDDFAEERQSEFESAMDRFEWCGVPHESSFEEGVAAEVILERAKSADLIAMGTHGRTGFAAALLGSVAYSVVRHATTPVLVVRDPRRVFQT
jgi:nucleotide-binding universal stress UspA family protein